MRLLLSYTINFKKENIFMEKLLDLLKSNFPSVDFEGCSTLVTGGFLDSVDIVSLVSEIEVAFDISISMEYIAPENFDSVEKIWAMIQELS